MEGQRMSCCGTFCSECEYDRAGCSGCGAEEGKVFWLSFTGGEVCGIYDCCVSQKGLTHCGMCKRLPCERYLLSDPTKSQEENQADMERQLSHLRAAPPLILNGPVLRLEQAAACHKQAAVEMKREFFEQGETVINGSARFDQMDFEAWLTNTNRNHHPETVRADWAVATTFFAVRQSDAKLLGMIDVRHSLAVPFLKEYGGHIGYAVRPGERRKGYATQMLGLGLQYCRGLGIQSVRLGCYTDNDASIRTITACGGVRVEEKPYADGKPMYIYSISV